MGKGHAGVVAEAALARRAAVALFLGTVVSIFVGSGIRAVWASLPPQSYSSTTLQPLLNTFVTWHISATGKQRLSAVKASFASGSESHEPHGLIW